MQRLTIFLKKQRSEIEKLKKTEIACFTGFGQKLIVFWSGACLQDEINAGKYESVEDFDSYHTADVTFYYRGKKEGRFLNKTKDSLIELGKAWRLRVDSEFPGVEVSIVVHFDQGLWFLDTYNHQIEIPKAIYL
jgi:hypothetical protein